MALAGFAVGAITGLALIPQARERLLPRPTVRVSGEARIGGPFTLTDHTGKRVTDADFRGRTMLVLFGSTSSDDATASALQVLSAVLDKLGPDAQRVVPVLIAVDPGRDTPKRLAPYVQRFHPRLVGLTGTPAEIAQAMDAYHIEGVRRGAAGSALDPPAFLYVIGPDGRYRGHLSFTAGVDAVAASLARML